MRRLMAALFAMTTLCCSCVAETSSADAAESVEMPVSSFLSVHPVPRIALSADYRMVVPATFSYSATTEQGNWLNSITNRFGSLSTAFVLNPGPASFNNPSFGQMGALPIFAGGMLRRLPQIPEGSFTQISAFGRELRSQMSISAGVRALDRANGIVAAIAFHSRYGHLSVERGESQGRFGPMSMQPVTIVRFELPRL